MAVTATTRRNPRPLEYDFEGYAVTGGETISSDTIWLEALIVTNNDTVDRTLTVTDNQGSPIGLYPNWIIPASATSSEPSGLLAFGVAIKLTSGLKITASANSTLYVRGSYSK